MLRKLVQLFGKDCGCGLSGGPCWWCGRDARGVWLSRGVSLGWTPTAGPASLCLLSVYQRVKDLATAPVSISCRSHHGSSEAERQPQFPPRFAACLQCLWTRTVLCLLISWHLECDLDIAFKASHSGLSGPPFRNADQHQMDNADRAGWSLF